MWQLKNFENGQYLAKILIEVSWRVFYGARCRRLWVKSSGVLCIGWLVPHSACVLSIVLLSCSMSISSLYIVCTVTMQCSAFVSSYASKCWLFTQDMWTFVSFIWSLFIIVSRCAPSHILVTSRVCLMCLTSPRTSLSTISFICHYIVWTIGLDRKRSCRIISTKAWRREHK